MRILAKVLNRFYWSCLYTKAWNVNRHLGVGNGRYSCPSLSFCHCPAPSSGPSRPLWVGKRWLAPPCIVSSCQLCCALLSLPALPRTDRPRPTLPGPARFDCWSHRRLHSFGTVFQDQILVYWDPLRHSVVLSLSPNVMSLASSQSVSCSWLLLTRALSPTRPTPPHPVPRSGVLTRTPRFKWASTPTLSSADGTPGWKDATGSSLHAWWGSARQSLPAAEWATFSGV